MNVISPAARKLAPLALATLTLCGLFVIGARQQPANAQTIAITDAATAAATSGATLTDIISTPTVLPTVAISTNGIAYYIVQPNENLYRIGLKFGLSIDQLAAANGIINPNLLVAGQKLIIPGVSPNNPLLIPAPATSTPVSTSAATAKASATGGATLTPTVTPTPHLTYTVQPGDNLFRIALKFNVPYAVLAQLNNLSNVNLVYVGQTIRLPAGVTLPTPTASAAPIGTITLNPANPTALATGAATISPIMEATGTPGSIGIAEVNTPVRIITLAPSPIPPTDTPLPPTATDTSTASPSATASPSPTLSPSPTVTPVPPTMTPTVPLTSSPTPINKIINFALGLTVSGDPNAAALGDLGIGWVQYTANWKNIETVQGSPDFAALDTAINAYVAANIKVLLTVTGAPNWARPVTIENGPPTDFSLFAAFAGTLASRYQGKVRAYEIWSEPNLRRNWNGIRLSAVTYVDLLSRAGAAIKAADATAIVVSAGLAPTGFNDGLNAINDRLFLKQAYAAGLANVADAIGAHPNGWANPPDATCCQASSGVTGWYNDRSFYFHDTLTDYRQIVVDNHDMAKKLWVTAFGWGSNDGVAPAETVNDQSFGFVRWTSQAVQAQYLLRALEIGKALGYIGPMFVYNLNGCQTDLAPDDVLFYPCYYSLLDSSGTQRPAYLALKSLNQSGAGH